MTFNYSNFTKNSIEELSKVGVYMIYHTAKPERRYVGSTIKYKSDRLSHYGFYKRFYDHYRILLLNKHHSKYLQNTVNKHGLEGLVFNIIESCENHNPKEVREREQYWINELKPVYNSFDTVFPKGRKWSENEKLNQSEKMKGISLPREVYEKIKKKTSQFSKEGNFIKDWDSIAEAAKSLKIDPASISNCIKNKRKSAGGFLWK